MHPRPSAVKRFALDHGLEVFQPETLKEPAGQARVRAAQPQALVVAAYGLLLPQPLLEAGRCGALNIHASLLPRWRGAAPIQRALLAGDAETGISIMQMDPGLDTGPVLMQRRIPIGPDEDASSLHDRLAAMGADMIVAALADLEAGRAHAVPQPADGVTYAPKIGKHDTALDWSRPAVELERAVRALRPSPGASTALDGEPVKIWRARVLRERLEPGIIAQKGGQLVVGCGEGALAIDELQRAGGKRMAAADFLRGRAPADGASFG